MSTNVDDRLRPGLAALRTPRLPGRLRRHLQLRRKPLLVLSLTAAALLVGAGLYHEAQQSLQARRSIEARAFENTPDAWLDRDRSASDFQQALDRGSLAAVGLVAAHPGLVLYTLRDGEKASVRVPGCSALGCAGTVIDRLGERSRDDAFALVAIDVDPRPAGGRLVDAVDRLLAPLALLAVTAALVLLALRRQTGIGGLASRLANRPSTRFADVIGNEEAKAALQRVRAFMQDPSHYAKLGASAPRGVLLTGPPGTGKTLLAKALAGETHANFIAVDGSYFTAMFYGAGVAKVKELFKLARRHAPCVLFIDEVDGIGRRSQGGANSGGGGGAESELNRIINRVLVEMDGFEALDNVVVVAATNHEEQIDEALRRPGRFDLLVRLVPPTLPERQRLFELCIARLMHDGSADCAALARLGAGMTPAEIANVVNKAASSAAEAGASSVTAAHLLRAIEAQQLGGEVSSHAALLTDATRERLAFHEAGHALVAHALRIGQVERISIEPRGKALGVTYISRENEEPLYQQSELSSRLAMMLGGREAELLVLGSVSTGASDDLKRASELAVSMVGSLGFSSSFGLLSVAGVPKELLGPDVQAALLGEARVLLEQAQRLAVQVLMQCRGTLDELAATLLRQETMGGIELRHLLDDVGIRKSVCPTPARPEHHLPSGRAAAARVALSPH